MVKRGSSVKLSYKQFVKLRKSVTDLTVLLLDLEYDEVLKKDGRKPKNRM